jgi:plastocyanin
MKRITNLSALAMSVIALGLLLGSCSSSASSKAANVTPSSGATITIHNFTFNPATLTVKPGTVVTIKNTDDTQHTVTALDGSFDTGAISGGKSATFAVSKAGTFKFHCNIHNYMTGAIQVRG